MKIPSATYRVQFNADFRFEHALAIVPQLHRLGISDLYASPVFAARPGSQHGYDVIDPNRLNPELGTPEDFDRLSNALRERGMGLLLDIVPNHMAASPANAWWMDVLENGSASRYAAYFGVNWSAAEDTTEGKIFLPILGAVYGAVLEKGELRFELGRRPFLYQLLATPVARGTRHLRRDPETPFRGTVLESRCADAGRLTGPFALTARHRVGRGGTPRIGEREHPAPLHGTP